MRSARLTFWETGVFSNLVLLGVIAVSIALQAALHVVPYTRELMQLRPPSAFDLGVATLVALIPVSCIELAKLAWRLWTRRQVSR